METDELFKIRILEKLGKGHNNAILLKNLCLLLGCKNERKVRLAIEDLRRERWAILIPATPPFGYFLAETQAELDEYIAYMRHRMVEEYKTYRIVKNTTVREFNKSVQLPLC